MIRKKKSTQRFQVRGHLYVAKRGGQDKSGGEGVTGYILVRINWGGQLNFPSEELR